MRAASIQFLSYAGWFSSVMLIPLFAKELGATEAEIGLIVAAYGIASLISSYIFGRLADIHGRRLFLRLGLALSAITCVFQLFADSTPALLLTRVTVGFASGIFPAALMAYAYESKWKMGKFAAFGSLGWGLGTITSGMVATVFSIRAPFGLSAVLFALAFILSMKMPPVSYSGIRVPLFPIKVMKKNLPVYLAVLVRHTGACSIWVIFPIFLTGLGANFFWIGVLYTINSVTQFLVMRVLKAKSARYIIWGLVLSAVTFISFTLCDNIWQLMPTQVLLAISWAFMYVGAINYIMRRNVERATATGLLNSTLNMSSIGGALIGGAIAGAFGYLATMYLAAAMSIAALFIFLLIHHSRRKKAMARESKNRKRGLSA